MNSKNIGTHSLITDFTPKTIPEGSTVCCECNSDVADFRCTQCTDFFCKMCYDIQHRSGKRKKHIPQTFQQWKKQEKLEKNSLPPVDVSQKEQIQKEQIQKQIQKEQIQKEEKTKQIQKEKNEKNIQNTETEKKTESSLSWVSSFVSPVFNLLSSSNTGSPKTIKSLSLQDKNDWWGGAEGRPNGAWFLERSKWIPLRLPLKERFYMRLVKAAMNVCPDPPDNIITTVSSVSAASNSLSASQRRKKQLKEKAQAIFRQLRNISGVLIGIAISVNFDVAQKLLTEESELKDHSDFFGTIFELCRRHKIRNPEKMRSEYGKLIYFLQDCLRDGILEELDFSPVKPIQTVHAFFQERNALDILSDELMPTATGEILAEGRTRKEINRSIRRKERAITSIAKRYESRKISEEEIRQSILSIGDNHNYLKFNRDPCNVMLQYLTAKFDPNHIKDSRYSLAIEEGEDGARLTHSHSKQYQYALQTLTLWRNILHNMYKLWMQSEADLLDPANPYELKDTGQGINRIQQCPRVWNTMRRILYNTQHQLESAGYSWVGSSVIHLGDSNVPNALMFIDKYNQVPRILLPIVTCLRLLPTIYARNDMRFFITKNFGSVNGARMAILTDFFRSAFDGSGADNFNSAGSCIDGRLTSAWHWGEMLHRKNYYSLFQLTGFTGFDGKF